MPHKPYQCTLCDARCKTIQGLRGHERFRHGKDASPLRRFWIENGVPVRSKTGEGFTHIEACDLIRWDDIMEKLDRIERKLNELRIIAR